MNSILFFRKHLCLPDSLLSHRKVPFLLQVCLHNVGLCEGPSLLINADISPTNTMSSVGTFRLPFAFAHEVTFPSSRYDLTIGHTSRSYEANSSTSLYHQKCNSEAIASSSVFSYTDAHPVHHRKLSKRASFLQSQVHSLSVNIVCLATSHPLNSVHPRLQPSVRNALFQHRFIRPFLLFPNPGPLFSTLFKI